MIHLFCDLLSLYPPGNFLGIRLRSIVAITNSNGDSASAVNSIQGVHGFLNKLHDFVGYLVHFVTVYPAWRGCPRGVMVKAMDCGIVVREFVLQSRYYVHFRANALGKDMNPLILPAMD